MSDFLRVGRFRPGSGDSDAKREFFYLVRGGVRVFDFLGLPDFKRVESRGLFRTRPDSLEFVVGFFLKKECF